MFKNIVLASLVVSIAFNSVSVAAGEARDPIDGLNITRTSGNWSIENTDTGDVISPHSQMASGTGELNTELGGERTRLKYTGLAGDSPLAFAAAISRNNLRLIWGANEPQTKIQIHRDDELIAEISDSNVKSLDVPISEIKPGTYTLTSQPSQGKASPSGMQSTISFAQIPLAFAASATASTNLVASLTTTLASTSVFRQTTFIPNQYVDAPTVACSPLNAYSYRFLGDNRTWSSSATASHRTRMDVVIDWVNGPSKSFSPLVGATHRQRTNDFGQWIDEDPLTASNSSMKMTVTSFSASSIAYHLRQDVTNPFCSTILTNGIASDTSVSMYRSGYVTGSITYLAMPNYEIYSRMDSNSYVPLAQLNLIGVYCLLKGPTSALCNSSAPF